MTPRLPVFPADKRFGVRMIWLPREEFFEVPEKQESSMSTFIPTAQNFERKWFVIDASGKTLGRLATQAASVLAGKNNPSYTPYIDTGDHIIVVNAEKIQLTGLKAQQKLYRRYTGFPGGLREESFTKLLARRPEAIIEQAIKGMLPKSKMGRQMGTKLKIYRGTEHPHQAQAPVALAIK
jgi:large subunit ribosomal protein L13